jgi:catechol 2,3-dioxygenase-like lactoylglutathione lyase family enzyme
MIEAVDHINIVVRNLERSVRFYSEILGFREIRRARLRGEWIEKIVGLKGVQAEVVYLLAPAGEPRIELLAYDRPKGEHFSANSSANTIGLRHIALRVKNIDECVEKLQGAGVEVFEQPVAVPTKTVTHSEGHKYLCYFTDPDGVLLELAEYK